MSPTTTVFVSVKDPLGELVTTAELTLRPVGETDTGAPPTPLPYRKALGLYVGEPVAPGEYLLTVEGEGFARQEITCRLSGPEYYDTVVLGPEGSPFYVENGRRIYFEPDGEKIAALVYEDAEGEELAARPRSAASEGLRRLEALIGPEARPKRGLRIFDRIQLDRLRAAEPLDTVLLEAPEVIDAGPLLRSAEPSGRFLSRRMEVEVEEGVSEAQLAALVAPFGLRIFERSPHDPSFYQLESTTIPTPELGALPEQLAQLEGIRSASSSITAPTETTLAIIPSDVGFSLQFHAHVTRVPEAWDLIDPANVPQSFGSADVIVAIHDAGILTTGGGSVVSHPEFSGAVTGGNLGAQPGLNNNKVLLTFDFNNSPMRAGNDFPTGSHGSAVAGIVTATTVGATGTVGYAANTRLCSYMFSSTNAHFGFAFNFMGGLPPGWRQGGAFAAGQPFPAPLGTGQSPIPGADVISCSHTLPFGLDATLRGALQRLTLFGRRRRGTLIFGAAGNQDQDCRQDGTWGENSNVMRISASSLDLRGEEVRMNYSSFAVLADRIVDFAAPSESQNVSPTVHQVPRMYGFITTSRNTGTGDLASSTTARAALTNSPAAGTTFVNVSAANLASFSVGDTVIVRNTTEPFFSELHTIAALPAGGGITLTNPLGHSYTVGSVELICLGVDTNQTTQFGGTSAATPQAAAIAALMLSVNPALSWLEVRELMRRTAVPINLRYRGSDYPSGADFRYRWLDTSVTPPVDLITAQGLLDVTGANRTISAGPVNRGARFLTLDSIAGIEPRQALVIGAETKLNGAHPRPTPNQNRLLVDRDNELAVGDQIFIGKNSQTVLIDIAAAGGTFIWVQSVDGFVPGDTLTLTGATTENVRITSIRRMVATTGPPANFGAASTGFNITRLNAAGTAISGGLRNAYARGDLVAIASSQFEGPFTITAKPSAGTLTLNNPVTQNHPDDRIVWKQGTEVKAVVRVFAATKQVEVDPLDFDHPLNADGVEHVRIGRKAGYSLGFGFGRLDAFEAVKAARDYDHGERDLVIRNFLADDGVTNTGAQPVDSSDVWVRNDTATTLATLPNYTDPGPHQTPAVTIDPAIFFGSGRNDLEVSGTCTSATERTFTITLATTGATDTFDWSRDGGTATTGVAITGNPQLLSDGVRIRFANLGGHTVGDRWIVKARQITHRFLHVRVLNRGTQPFFTPSVFGTGTPLDVARSRLLLCASDGLPVCRFSSTAATAGNNDCEVIAAYTGARPRALYSVVITAAAAGGATFVWHRDGTARPPIVLTPAALTHALDDGVQIRFGAHTGHAIGDRWDIHARAGVDAFLNLDHYWEVDEPTPFSPTSATNAGTRLMAETAIGGLAAATAVIHSVAWPEALRPPTNSPNQPKPARPLRLFALGEAVPHDGALTGLTAATNNNFSFRELVFAKLGLLRGDGSSPLETHVDVDNLGTPVTKTFRAELRTTAGTFSAEKARVRMTARRVGGIEEVCEFGFEPVVNDWLFTATGGSWATFQPPVEARRPDGTAPLATGEVFDVSFTGTLTVDRGLERVDVVVEILSSFFDTPVAALAHTVHVVTALPLPSGVGFAKNAALPKPASFVFADMATLTQGSHQAFGPVHDPLDADSRRLRYRTTSLFSAPADVKAYAVIDGVVALQRDPASTETVNLVLRPLVQAIAGLTPVRYFLYRGLRLDGFLAGSSAAEEKKIRAKAGASPFLTEVWMVFETLNPGVAEMPASVLGYDPDTQTAADRLDALFFRIGAATQLPLVRKGTELGLFRGGGGKEFGFEIVLEEGTHALDLGYARRAVNVIDVSALPAATPAERFALRIRREEILAFMDPAAFYGLHLHTGGKVEVAGAAEPLTGQDVFQQIVDKFHTRNQLTIDVRSENGSSLGFYGNYDDGAGNQVRVGRQPGGLTPRGYATHDWPILLLDLSAPTANTTDFDQVGLELRIDDNEKGVVFIDHGQLLTPPSNGPFVRGAELRTGAEPWTRTLGFRFPNTGPAGARQGVAWMLRLFYGRLENPAPSVPVPAGVLRAQHFTDNVFGPIDRSGRWAGSPGIAWYTTQDKRYVDAESTLGWKQMMEHGVAFQTATTSRALFYAVVAASDTYASFPFVPIRGITDGTSGRASFFDERGLFGTYLLEQDQIDDGTTVRTLRLRQHPVEGYPPSNVLLLGLEKTELDGLKGLSATGIEPAYLRNLVLDAREARVDPNGRPYERYRVGIQGLCSADGEHRREFPAVDLHVYTLDGQFFFSKAFADAEPLPSSYSRSFEEEKGTRLRPAIERRIGAVSTAADTVTLIGHDARREIAPGDPVKISGSAANDGLFPVVSVARSADDTVITLGGAGIAAATAPLGSLFTLPKPIEDVMIDLDFGAALSGVGKLRDLVNGFLTASAAIVNNAGALAALRTQVDDVATKIVRRARLLAQAEPARADDFERALYWARLRLGVAIKSHPFALASLSGRNELLALLEQKSRGYDVAFTAAPGGARKILLVGFDPFELEVDLATTNPAAAVALALHGRTLTAGGKNGYVETVILPVRYREMDGGRVETLVDPRLAGTGRVDVILSLSRQGTARDSFDLERFASRRRGGGVSDNAFVLPVETSLGTDATHAELYETNLPVATLVPGPFLTPPDPAQRLFFNESYETVDPAGTQTHPKDGGANTNAPSFALAGITGKARKGSAGAYLANELFYRIAQRRQQLASTTLTGHLALPKPGGAAAIDAIIGEVENLLRRWLGSLP